jgi:small-conductance mechanosensitive channel
LNTEAIKVLLFLLGGLMVALLFHLLISRLHRRLERRLSRAREEGQTEATPTFDPLITDWIARGLRLMVWILYLVYSINLLPQTRTQFETATDRLLHTRDRFLDWLLDRGIPALIIITVTIFLVRFAGALVKTGFDLVERRSLQRGNVAAQRRLQTLSSIFCRLAQAVVLFIGLLELLHQLNLNITPILASAGVVGIAVGFGAQSLIKDLFAGLLILIEDQYRVGDSVKVGEISGTVENLTMRATFIRGLEGALTVIPNGAITTVSNLSRDWSRAVIDVEVDYHENLDRVMTLMLDTARAMRAENPQEVIDEPTMLGIDRLTGSSAVLRMLVKTAPSRHVDVARELRRRIKTAFDQAGIQTPPPLRLADVLKDAGTSGTNRSN